MNPAYATIIQDIVAQMQSLNMVFGLPLYE